MSTKLLVDAGSTKVDWLYIYSDGKVASRHSAGGLNALLADEDVLLRACREAHEALGVEIMPDEIHYYGAGCATPEICEKVKNALQNIWPEAKVHVASDLLGAARSLLGHDTGIVCILGTGSNSCLYNGSEIEKNVPSMGYILGDEGSGSALGKRLLSDAFKGHLPKAIADKLLTRYRMDLSSILNHTYRMPAPNKFLASFVPFIAEHLWNPYVYSIVFKEFTAFLKRNVAMYPGAHRLPLAFTGSIAYYFEKILREAADRQGYKVGKISRTPTEGLIAYHKTEGNV